MEMFRKSIFIFSLLLLLTTSGCVKPSGGSLQNQAPDRTQQKALAEFKAAEILFQQNKMAQALVQYQSIAKQYYNTTSADNAMLRIAQIYKREKNVPVATVTLKKILTLYPESDVKPQALRELVAITLQQNKYEEALQYIIEIDLKKLSAKEQAALTIAANTCLQKVKREDLTLLWNINRSDIQSTPELQKQIIEKVTSLNDKILLEKIIDRRKTLFPAQEAVIQRYRLAKDSNDSDTKKWAFYIVEHFPTSDLAQQLRTEISEPIPFSGTGNYKIGVLLPLTGDQQVYGQQVLNGIKAAIEIVKQTNPSQGIQLVVEDIGLGGDAVKQALQKLLIEHQIIAAIGPLSIKDTESVAEMAQINNLPLISLTPAENVTSLGGTIFRNSITKNEQAVALAQFLTDIMGIKRAAILYPNNSYGKEFMEMFWEEFVKKGGEIRGAEEYDRATSDYETSIKKLVGLFRKDLRKDELCSKIQSDQWIEMKKMGGQLPNCFPIEELPPILDFEAIFIPESFDKARQILPTLLFHEVKGMQVVGTNLWNTDELLSGSIGGEIEGSIFLDGFYKARATPEVINFMQKYYELNNAEPGILEAQGYDSAMVLLNVIQKKSPSSREAMVKNLLKLTDFKGVTGLTGFSSKREAIRTLTTLIVDQNRIVELK
jgi:branched-chain amino acid transport system substrate-binding protein